MNDLSYILERLELSQYLDNFVEEGFDTWDTVLYITESDLDALNVKLGHRRRLQREIAHARGIPFENLLAQSGIGSPSSSASIERGRASINAQSEAQTTTSAGPTKRKYRRHPKPDENAPERPPSAYVIFSTQIREELKPQRLSFAEIAKSVGERWQGLTPDEKEPYETQATLAKKTYNREMASYKKTTQYRDYMQYLNDFRAKTATSAGDGKRTRLEKEPSRGSSGAGSPAESPAEPAGLAGPRRPQLSTAASGSSASSASPTSTVPSATPIPPRHTASPPSNSPRHQLPRIVPLGPQDAQSPPNMSDSGFAPVGNVRRTTAISAPSFLRHDTSKSSVSSNFSGASVASSSQFTPVTPIDEGMPHRMHANILPPLTHPLPPAPRYTHSPQLGHHLGSGKGTAIPIKRLSLGDEPPDWNTMHPRSDLPEPPNSGIPGTIPASTTYSSPRHQTSISGVSDRPLLQDTDRESDRERERERKEPERLDPLSVLALAGNLIERRPGQAPGHEQPRDRPL